MPFIVIRGTFRLVGKNQQGVATGFQPDGDSIQFRPDNPKLLDQLRRRRLPYKLTGIKSVNLRFEGIDAPELHYVGRRQPAPFAEDARDYLTGKIGMNPVAYKPNGITVLPLARDGQPGYIFSRELEDNGRPVSFVFTGKPTEADGAQVTLTLPRLRQSLNYKLIASGQAYPLFYDSLFFDLRQALTSAAQTARHRRWGVWRANVLKQFTLRKPEDAEAAELLYPKLFRRLADFLKLGNDLGGFVQWMNDTKQNDEVWTLPELNRTHLDNIIRITGKHKIQLLKLPMQLVFVSK